tara:strand:+ start:202 stop:2322 length:2121 start_codon:yes stop_codon:yes gene_type:complete
MVLIKKIIFILIFFNLNINAFAFTDPNHVDDFDISGVETISTSVKFSSDGKTMFIIGVNSDTLRQFSLSTAFDLSSSPTLVNSLDISSIQDAAQDIEFNSDGTVLFIIGREVGNRGIDRWDLNTPYDLGGITVGDATREPLSGDLRGFKFSNDGKKLFTITQTSSTVGTVTEYTLTTAYDLDTLSETNTLTTTFSVEGRRQGINFSSDGYKLFITNSAVHASTPVAAKNVIREFSLNTPFNITNPTNNGDFQPGYTAKFRLTGLTFNNDGSKMFHTDFTNNDVHEYTLSCGFGVKTCTDPTNDNDDVASIEAQSESAKKLIQHTTYPVLNRMEWLRRNSNRINLTNQNIKFQFNNEILNSLTEEFIPLYFSNDNSSELSQNTNWSFWSEGTISIGKIGDTSNSSSKDVNTSAITLGADKRGKDNIMRGIALRFGNDDVDVGDLGSALNMSSFSLTFYESKPRGGDRFTDHLLGLSFINSDLINNSGSVSTNGERYGEQLYGSLSLRDTFSKNKFNFTPKIKINYGLTHFGEYTEAGAAGLNLKFDEQYLGNFTSSLGASLDNTYELKIGSLIPYFDFEYYADMSPSSQQKFSYTSNGSAYTFKNINNATHNIISGIGFDLISNNGLTLMTKYTRDQARGNKNDNFVVALDYKNSQRSSYSMSLQDSFAKIEHHKELDNIKINLDSHYELFKNDPDYGLYVTISNIK